MITEGKAQKMTNEDVEVLVKMKEEEFMWFRTKDAKKFLEMVRIFKPTVKIRMT